MLERVIETKVCKYAKDLGILVYKFSSPSNRGIPDRIYFYAGRVWCIEFKRLGKKPSTLQSYTMDLIEAAGTPCYVVDEVEAGKKLLDELVKGNVFTA